MNTPFSYSVTVVVCEACGTEIRDRNAVTEEDYRRRRIRRFLYWAILSMGFVGMIASIVAAIKPMHDFMMSEDYDRLAWLLRAKLNDHLGGAGGLLAPVLVLSILFSPVVGFGVLAAWLRSVVLREDQNLIRRGKSTKVALVFGFFPAAMVLGGCLLITPLAWLWFFFNATLGTSSEEELDVREWA